MSIDKQPEGTRDPLEVVRTNDEGTVVGRAVIQQGTECAWLTLEVSPEERGHHVGADLANASLREARAHDVPTLKGAFSQGDPAALALVRDCGCAWDTHAGGYSCIATIDTRPDQPR